MSEGIQAQFLSTARSFENMVSVSAKSVGKALKPLQEKMEGILKSGAKLAQALPLSSAHAEKGTFYVEKITLQQGNSYSIEHVQAYRSKPDTFLQHKINTLKNSVTASASSLKTAVGTPLANGIQKAHQVFTTFIAAQSERLNSAQDTFKQMGTRMYEALTKSVGGRQKVGQAEFDKKFAEVEDTFGQGFKNLRMGDAQSVENAKKTMRNFLAYHNITSSNPEQNAKMNLLLELSGAFLNDNLTGWAENKNKKLEGHFNDAFNGPVRWGPLHNFSVGEWSQAHAHLQDVDVVNNTNYAHIQEAGSRLQEVIILANNLHPDPLDISPFAAEDITELELRLNATEKVLNQINFISDTNPLNAVVVEDAKKLQETIDILRRQLKP